MDKTVLQGTETSSVRFCSIVFVHVENLEKLLCVTENFPSSGPKKSEKIIFIYLATESRTRIT